MMQAWQDEVLYPDWTQRFRIKRQLARFKSEYQDILVFESFSHGTVLMLDGVVQITEADEFIYQEMLAHVPLIAHGRPRRVLIIGAGDGGVLRRVLEHETVERAVLVEIDGEVIRLSREFLPGIGGSAWTDQRAEIIVGDGIAYAAHAPDAAFDVVIVDSTDPAGVGEPLFSDAFYADCARLLSPDGVLVNQGGVPFMQSAELRQSSLLRARHFPAVSAYLVSVPTYVGGSMALGFAAKVAGTAFVPLATLRTRAQAAGILGRTRYWTPEVHAAAFSLPPYVADCLPSI